MSSSTPDYQRSLARVITLVLMFLKISLEPAGLAFYHTQLADTEATLPP